MTLYKHPHGRVFYRKMSHGRPQISHGDGIYLYDVDGKQYIDGSGGPLVVNVGHGRAEVVQAMAEQAQKAAYVHALMFTSQPVEQLSAELAEYVPLTAPRFFYLSSGSEVVEGAIKLARQIQQARGEHGRHLIIGRDQSYHGTTLGALAVSGRPGLRAPYLPMLRDMPHIAPPYTYRDPVSGTEAANRLEAAILQHGADQVAAFIAEPISGASLGAALPPDDYWPRIRQICDQYGVLLIADEVLVGLGRTGKWWGIDHWNVKPDILVSSKGLAGGYFPLGFIAAEHADVERIRQELGDWNHGGTFSHHAVGCAAALATLRIITRDRLVDNSAVVGAQMGRWLRELLADHPHVGDIRGRGLFWGIELVQDKTSQRPFAATDKLDWRIWEEAFARGLVVYHSQGCANGRDGDLIMLGPPLITNADQAYTMVTLLNEAIRAVL